ncbi:glycosyltransferase family 4 protein [Patescibacteria group bacterium]|nr:glycosyltransferase family 4 protein [Patescibacteria group bacterium]MCL5091216.1 glycosyltransferase family 4 protein [Patescibacteria group bacterium]
MKILMLTPYLPYPPASGGQIRTLNLIRYLSRKHDITLISLYKTEAEKKYLSHLQLYCRSVYLCKRPGSPWQLKNIGKALLGNDPFLIVRNYSPEAKSLLSRLLKKENYDVIHAETFYIMPHLPPTAIPIFLLEQTIEYKVYQHFVNQLPPLIKPFFLLDIMKLKRSERYYWRNAMLVGTVSDTDRKIIKALEPSIKPVVVPNGAGEEMVARTLPLKKPVPPRLLFQGNFSWLQNTEAAQYLITKIYPQIKQDFPRLELIIAGQNAQNKIKPFHDRQIKIVDIPPENSSLVKRLYQQSTVFLAPIFGPGGTRLKILAAMATGLPVISTKIGVQGLEVTDRVHVLIANQPKEFVRQIRLILSNRSLYRKIQQNAYRLVKEKYNWKTIAQQLEIIYEKIKRHENRG